MVLSRYGIRVLGAAERDIKYKGCCYGSSTNLQYGYEAADDSSGSYTQAEINVYELAHKCKEWAFDLGIEVSSGKDVCKEGINIDGYYPNINYGQWRVYCMSEAEVFEAPDDYFYADTESEAIFKACEWILSQQEKEIKSN